MIPDVEFLRSSVMKHKFGDLFNPPALTNFLGVVQAELDLTAISSLNMPPFAIAHQHTASLFLNDRFFQATGCPVSFTWYPDHILRSAEYKGLYCESTTVLAVKKKAALMRLAVENRSGENREVKIGIGLQGGITQSVSSWNKPSPPSENDNEVIVDTQRKALIFLARHSKAVMVQGMFPLADNIDNFGLEYKFLLKPGETWVAGYVNAIADNESAALNLYDNLITGVDKEIKKSHNDWNEELKSIFTPGNSRFSGSLPELETSESDIQRLYALAALGVVYFKRDIPESVYGRAYDTLMPRYWQSVTFIWDYALGSFVHALLDPVVMQKYLQYWMKMDIHKHFGTEYLTGGAVGYWYAANDFNMMVLLNDYLRWTGNYEWLNEEIVDPANSKCRQVIDYIEEYATGWKKFKSPNGLADYGEIDNLMECVSTYIHEVASLNAANVFNMRTASKLFAILGKSNRASILSAEAQDVLGEVRKLYVEDKGRWYSRFPDGSLVDVRHCYDFFTILNTISDDLSIRQRDEMVEFFKQELQSPTWMRALAPSDKNAMFSVRPDHQWNGAYPAWPAHSLKALYKIGKKDLAFKWLKGLAKSFNQGPLGQAHFVDDVIDPESGGARKAAPGVPYMTDWACSGGGSWVSVIIESLFGIKAELDAGISAKPQFASFDSKAELHNLAYRGKYYNVSKNGLKRI